MIELQFTKFMFFSFLTELFCFLILPYLKKEEYIHNYDIESE